MKPKLLSNQNYDEKILEQFKKRLKEFYNKVSDYTAFESPSEQTHCWKHIADKIRQLATVGKKVRVLEIGAGRSGFGIFLLKQGLRNSCIWVAQDVTVQNKEWLEVNADEIFLGDIETFIIDGEYDIVFSTFVLEHVVNPSDHLKRLAKLVKPACGILFIFCPRYDLPFYLTPSSRHLNIFNKINFLSYSLFSRIRTIVTGKPAFLIQTDLAAFHHPFFTDADAVHWSSLFDLKCFARGEGAVLNQLKIGNPKFLSKDWIVKRFLTIAVSISFE